jgi:hypothetical protein
MAQADLKRTVFRLKCESSAPGLPWSLCFRTIDFLLHCCKRHNFVCQPTTVPCASSLNVYQHYKSTPNSSKEYREQSREMATSTTGNCVIHVGLFLLTIVSMCQAAYRKTSGTQILQMSNFLPEDTGLYLSEFEGIELVQCASRCSMNSYICTVIFYNNGLQSCILMKGNQPGQLALWVGWSAWLLSCKYYVTVKFHHFSNSFFYEYTFISFVH